MKNAVTKRYIGPCKHHTVGCRSGGREGRLHDGQERRGNGWLEPTSSFSLWKKVGLCKTHEKQRAAEAAVEERDEYV